MSRYPLVLSAIVVAVATAASPTSRHATQQSTTITDSLRVYYVGRPVGWERYSLTTTTANADLIASLDYVDRGRRNHIVGTASYSADFALQHLDVERVTDTNAPITKVDVNDRHATVLRGGVTTTVDLPAVSFAISPYTPVAQHLGLIRYWQSHGRPKMLAIVPGLPTDNVTIQQSGIDTLMIGGGATPLTRYTIDGVIWGAEYLWLDAAGRIAFFTAGGGGLSFKEIRADLVPAADDLMRLAARVASADLAAISARVAPIATGSIALVGATLVRGTQDSAVRNATVVVANGRIVAAGPSARMPVPKGARVIDVRGKTIIPGLWDMHAHLHQLDWVPVYLAAGVTTVRDMGNEIDFITALRSTVQSGRAAGPNILMAGLVDGPGPNAFGALSAATTDEGRAIVRRYHDLGFEQMKLYSLLSPAVVGAICDEAHKLGMTVTGHIPTSLNLDAAVDSGMDQVAHLAVTGDPKAENVKRTIEHLRAKGTVMDPTVSWNEIGGHSTAEPLQNFQPVTQHLPDAFMVFRAAGWGSANTDSATAHARLARSLAVVRALHDAGVSIVAGTDEGVPGFSVYREMELYVQAGLTPLEALRAATAVSATAMRRDKDLGTIEVGKVADLLVLDANPLDKISNVRTVRLVMKAGALYESSALWRNIGFKP